MITRRDALALAAATAYGQEPPKKSPERRPSADYLRSVLIVRMKRRTPIECVREDQLHFFVGAR
jgi:hypothetical protein